MLGYVVDAVGTADTVGTAGSGGCGGCGERVGRWTQWTCWTGQSSPGEPGDMGKDHSLFVITYHRAISVFSDENWCEMMIGKNQMTSDYNGVCATS